MKITFHLSVALTLMFLNSCAVAQSNKVTDPEYRIVGTWRGIGAQFLIVMTFNKDHSWYYEDEKAHPSTWTYANGQYVIKQEEANLKGRIDEQGRLVLVHDLPQEDKDDPPVQFILRREGEKEPTQAATPAVKVPPATPKALVGEWRLACVDKCWVPGAAPAFDALTFKNEETLRNTSTLGPVNIDTSYTLAGTTLTMKAANPKAPFPPMAVRLEDQGKKLVLTPLGVPTYASCDIVYLRADQFLPYDLTGKWVKREQDGGMRTEMGLGQDGRMTFVGVEPGEHIVDPFGPKYKPVYRLWSSPFGKTMTIITFRPGEGIQMHVLQIDRKGDTLTRTPILWKRESEKLEKQPEAADHWDLKKSQ